MTTLSKQRRALALLGLASLAACSKPDQRAVPAGRITLNDFEAVEGWSPTNPSLTAERAHSGRFAVKVDKDIEFGAGYINSLGQVSPQGLRKLHLRAWALRSGNEAKAAVVVQVVNPNDLSQQAYWQSLDLTQEVKTYNRWTEVRQTFELPAGLPPTQQLRVYLWRTGGSQPVYLDDVELVRD